MKLLFGIKSMDVAGGGAERVLAIVASGLAKRGHDVSVLSFDAPGGNSFYPLDPGVRRICIGMGPTDSSSGVGDFFRRLPALRRVLKDEHPDVAIGFMHSMFVPMAFAMIGASVPLVASEHIVPQYYDGKRFQYGLFIAGCLIAERVTVLSEEVRLLYPRLVRKRMTPMPNPVGGMAGVLANPGGEDRTTQTVLSVGRLEYQKDHATLIKAFARASGAFTDWKLRIVGEGNLRKDLEALVSRLNLEDKVELPGTTTNIGGEYAAAQVLAVSSRFESFGLVTAEAMAVGLPVIGFADCPGTRELIRHGHNGWLVSGGSDRERVDSMAAGLTELLSDSVLRNRLGKNGPGTVRPFAPDLVTSLWETLILDVLAGR